jgi:hypothetical protein
MFDEIARETEAYQALLEGRRAHPHDEALTRDLALAKAALDSAWLRRLSTAVRAVASPTA